MSAGTVPPAGFHSVTPRIVVSDVAAAADFLRAVFGATGEVRDGRPAELRIGDSVVMVSAAGQRELFPAFLTCTSTTLTALTGGRWPPERPP
jgi:uncharacterized glyoxalase superfamily protein PhnB